jgi:hypothetical protein
MNLELSCECSAGKRPLDVRMTLKYIVKKNISAVDMAESGLSVSLLTMGAIGHDAASVPIYFPFP